ncbi:MAG: hypothetical protein AB7M05_14005 [Alphaproteobacteria bacterium]
MALLGALMVGGCAFGNESDFLAAKPDLQIATAQEIAIGTQDRRPKVVSGSYSLTYTGETRGQANIPFGVHTESGRPLAEDVNLAVANALTAKNIQVTLVPIPPRDDRPDTIKRLTDIGKPRALLVSIDEWQTDMGPNSMDFRTVPGGGFYNASKVGMSVAFALRADVFDAQGNELASSDSVRYGRIKDVMQDASMWTMNIHTPASKKATAIAQDVLQKLLNDPKIVEALK